MKALPPTALCPAAAGAEAESAEPVATAAAASGDAPAAAPADASKAAAPRANKVYYLVCTFCHWCSRDSAIADQLQRTSSSVHLIFFNLLESDC